MPSNKKHNSAARTKFLSGPLLRRRVLKCIRNYGAPMPISKIPDALRRAYGPPTITQVFGWSAHMLLEYEMHNSVKVTFDSAFGTYFAEPIRDALIKPVKRALETKEEEEDEKEEDEFEQTVNECKIIMDLIRDSNCDWLRYSALPQLFKEKTGAEFDCEMFGCSSLLQLIRGLSEEIFVDEREDDLWLAVKPKDDYDYESEHEYEAKTFREVMGFRRPILREQIEPFDLKPPKESQPVSNENQNLDESKIDKKIESEEFKKITFQEDNFDEISVTDYVQWTISELRSNQSQFHKRKPKCFDLN